MKKLLLEDTGGNILILQQNTNGKGMHLLVSRFENISSMKEKTCIIHLTPEDAIELSNAIGKINSLNAKK